MAETERRKSDPAFRDRLDEIEAGYLAQAEHNHALIERLSHRTMVLLGLLFLLQVATGLLALSLNVRSDNNAAASRNLSELIQRQRIAATWSMCQAQNNRHDSTIDRLDRLIAKIKDPVERAKSRETRGGTVSLIEALAPKADCRALLRERIGLRGVALQDALRSLRGP